MTFLKLDGDESGTPLWKKVGEGQASPETIASMERRRGNGEYLSKHGKQLLERYPEQWIAVAECRVVAHDPDHRVVHQELERQAIPRDDAVVEFLSRVPLILRLA